MNIHSKRILILFSLALNIGFAITAIIVFFMHPPRHWHPGFRVYAEKAIVRLGLPAEREKSIFATLDHFEQEREESIRSFHKARSSMLRLLAQPGPLDRHQFDVLINEIDRLVVRKHEAIRDHVLNIREQLGDEKGAAFFATMLAHVEARKASP